MIRLIKVCKSFGKQKVLVDLDLDIPPEKTTVILGQSGSGKSVILKHIIALMNPDSGQILVNGTDITRLNDKELNEIRKNFGMLFQDAALFDSMTVGENVAFPLKEHTRLSQKQIKTIVEEKLMQVGLKDVTQKMPAELSGGMRKRVGLARAIALDPKIILFDEPITGLDPIMSDAIDNLIIQTQQHTKATCVVITHNIESTFKIAHRIAILYEGKIVECGTPPEIEISAHPFVQRFINRKTKDSNCG
ncbi:MAG: ABC transporter ATP-binding protein [Deltaproteobacteria bacterium RBG_13_49_15]|nr:MAG: ABC transporter ATP-binding protein [Deltaproteobacteria bacterium RBG_13_49_15]